MTLGELQKQINSLPAYLIDKETEVRIEFRSTEDSPKGVSTEPAAAVEFRSGCIIIQGISSLPTD